jgi:single-stranded-DNA-specific exonuclease
VLRARVVGERHVKLQLRPLESRAAFDAIAFNYLGEEVTAPPAGRVRLVYRLDINEFRGERRLQLMVDHLQSLP